MSYCGRLPQGSIKVVFFALVVCAFFGTAGKVDAVSFSSVSGGWTVDIATNQSTFVYGEEPDIIVTGSIDKSFGDSAWSASISHSHSNIISYSGNRTASGHAYSYETNPDTFSFNYGKSTEAGNFSFNVQFCKASSCETQQLTFVVETPSSPATPSGVVAWAGTCATTDPGSVFLGWYDDAYLDNNDAWSLKIDGVTYAQTVSGGTPASSMSSYGYPESRIWTRLDGYSANSTHTFAVRADKEAGGGSYSSSAFSSSVSATIPADITCTVNGVCKSSTNGGTFSSRPSTSNLCSSGTYQWNDSSGSDGTWNWTCLGSGGGSSPSCSATNSSAVINGSCGTANGTSVASAPASNLCSTGSTSWTDSTASDGSYNWSCAGTNGGTTANCSATRTWCSIPWGGTLSSGSSVTAYQNATVAYGSSCVSQTRTCTNGTLSGSYTNQSCSVDPAASCSAGVSKSWTVGLNTCDSTTPATASGANGTVTDSAAPTTGSAAYLCTNGTWASSPVSGATCTGRSATVTAPDCTITVGNSSCTSSVSWSSVNTVGSLSVRHTGLEFSTSASNAGTSRTLTYAGNPHSFTFSDSSGQLTLDTASAVCEDGTSWNGSMCATNTINLTSDMEPTVNGTLSNGSLLESQSYTFNGRVRNSGTLTISTAFSDNFTYCWGIGCSDWQQIGSHISKTVPMSSDSTQDDTSASFTIAGTGNLRIQHCIDSQGEVSESNESDNCQTAIFTVIIPPPTSHTCTGTVPSNAAACSLDDPTDPPYSPPTSYRVIDSCAYSGVTSCDYLCQGGFITNGAGTSCIPTACADGADNTDTEDILVDTLDPGCHTDGDPNNPVTYDENDDDETNLPTTLTATSRVVEAGDDITLTYNTQGLTCDVTQNGTLISGLEDITGTASVGPVEILANTTFILNCDGDSSDRTVRVEIVPRGFET